MKLLQIVVIAIFAIVLSHWTIKNLLSPVQTRQKITTEHSTSSDLLNFVRQHLVSSKCAPKLSESVPVRSDKPKASNYYAETHDADLHDQRTDLSKFFEVEQSVPSTQALLQQISGACSSGGGLTGSPGLTDPQTGNNMSFDFGSDGTPTLLPDQWSYNNEKIMNGGFLDGVRGFDTEISDHSVYPVDATKSNYTAQYPYAQSFGKY